MIAEIDLLDRDRFTQGIPHEWFTWLRANAPVFHHDEPDGDGFWVITRYDDIVTANRDAGSFSSSQELGGVVMLEGPTAPLPGTEMAGEMMLFMDPPRHTRYRKLVNRGFTPRMIAALEVHVRDLTVDIVETAIRKREQLQIGVVNAAKLVNMRRDQTLFDDVTSSDMVLADGMAVVWASRILGDALPERVAGIDLMMGMLERANKQGYRIFLLGATEEVSAGVAARMAKDFPNAVLAGRHDGYFKEPDEERVVEQIATSRPDILLVAMTSPKKEKFMARWSERMGVPVCHGVGGMFAASGTIIFTNERH